MRRQSNVSGATIACDQGTDFGEDFGVGATGRTASGGPLLEVVAVAQVGRGEIDAQDAKGFISGGVQVAPKADVISSP
jgi:hypothetical protein